MTGCHVECEPPGADDGGSLDSPPGSVRGEVAVMVLITLLKFAALVLGLFLVPGLFLARLIGKGKLEDAPVAVAFAVGTSWTCFWGLLSTALIGLVAPFHLSAALLAGIALATTAACIVALRMTEGGFAFLRDVLVTRIRKAFSPGLFAFLCCVSLLFLLCYDSLLFDQERCLSRAGMLPCFDYLTADPPVGFNGCLDCFRGRNAFLLWNGGQRMGPAVFSAPFMALFGFAGFRAGHFFFLLLTAWFGYHLGRSLLGRSSLGYLLAAVLALNPAVLSIPLEDENTMCLGLGTAMFYFLLRRQPQWFLGGMFFGLLLGIRHVGLLSAPAILLLVWSAGTPASDDTAWGSRWIGTGRTARLVLFLAGTVLFSSPCGITHAIAFFEGRPLFESFISMPPATHSFLGFEFSINGLLSWPFVPEPIRSPYNGFPTLLAFPLVLVRTFGIVGIALVPVGIWWGLRRYRTATAVGLLWFLPQLTMLCTMGNWVEPNKMGVYLSFAQPVAVAVVFGLAALVETYAPLLRGAASGMFARLIPDNPAAIPRVCRVSSTGIFGGVTLLLAVLQPLCAGWEAPVDRRNFKARVAYAFDDYPVTPTMLVRVEPDYARLDRERLTRRSLLPDFTQCRDLWLPTLLAARWRNVVDDFSAPSFARFRERPKDRFHTLSGVPAPRERTTEGLGPPDLRRGPRVLMADLMHHPVSRLRDAMAGDGRNDGTATGQTDDGNAAESSGLSLSAGRTVRFDLTVPPASGMRFLLPGEACTTSVRVHDRIVVATDLVLPWTDGLPCHLAVIPVRPGSYWAAIWYGPYSFDHLATRDDVTWLRGADPANLCFELPEGSILRVNDLTSMEPSRFHVWTALAAPDVPVWGPIPSSY